MDNDKTLVSAISFPHDQPLQYEAPKSSKTAINLPAKLFSRILHEAILSVPLEERISTAITLSSISRHARHLIVSNPSLWSHIENASEEITRLCFERSQACPMTVKHTIEDLPEPIDNGGHPEYRVPYNKLWTPRVAGLLATCASSSQRIRELDIEAYDGVLREALSRLGNSAPVLESLRIDMKPRFGFQDGLDFALDAPRLKVLHLINCGFRPAAPMLHAHLRVLRVECLRGLGPTLSEWLDLLPRLTSLETLDMQRSLHGPGDKRKILLPHLRELRIEDHPSLMSRLWQSLELAPTCRTCLTTRFEGDESDFKSLWPVLDPFYRVLTRTLTPRSLFVGLGMCGVMLQIAVSEVSGLVNEEDFKLSFTHGFSEFRRNRPLLFSGLSTTLASLSEVTELIIKDDTFIDPMCSEGLLPLLAKLTGLGKLTIHGMTTFLPSNIITDDAFSNLPGPGLFPALRTVVLRGIELESYTASMLGALFRRRVFEEIQIQDCQNVNTPNREALEKLANSVTWDGKGAEV